MTIHQPTIIDLGHSEIIIRSDEIVQVNTTDHYYTELDIKTINKAVGDLTPNREKKLLLIMASNYSSVEPEGRRYMSTPEGVEYSIAEAYVIRSLAQRLLINFLIKINKTFVPVQFFTNKETAIAWLNTFK